MPPQREAALALTDVSVGFIIPFFLGFSFIYRRMSLSYSNASTARIISRASTFLLLIILSYDVFTSPLSLSRLYDDLFPALPSLGSDGPPSRVPLRECSEGWYR